MNMESYSLLWTDHLLVAVFAVVFPFVGYLNYRKSVPKLLSGELSRSREYLRTMTIQWVLGALGVALWHSQGRDWTDLGVSFQASGRFALAAVLVAGVIVFFVVQLLAVRRGNEAVVEKLAIAFEPVKPLMPHSPTELHVFFGMSLTAAIVEELLWRGFLIAYLSQVMSIWSAGILSAVIFGLGHSYQGIRNTPRICAVGLVFAGLYLLSGSLWLPMLLHLAMDVLQGRTALDVVQANGQSSEA